MGYPKAKAKARVKTKDQRVKENSATRKDHHPRVRVMGRVDTREKTPTRTKSVTTATVKGISKLIAVFELKMKRVKVEKATSLKAMQLSLKKSPKVNHCQLRLIKMNWIHLLQVPSTQRS